MSNVVELDAGRNHYIKQRKRMEMIVGWLCEMRRGGQVSREIWDAFAYLLNELPLPYSFMAPETPEQREA